MNPEPQNGKNREDQQTRLKNMEVLTRSLNEAKRTIEAHEKKIAELTLIISNYNNKLLEIEELLNNCDESQVQCKSEYENLLKLVHDNYDKQEKSVMEIYDSIEDYIVSATPRGMHDVEGKIAQVEKTLKDEFDAKLLLFEKKIMETKKPETTERVMIRDRSVERPKTRLVRPNKTQ